MNTITMDSGIVANVTMNIVIMDTFTVRNTRTVDTVLKMNSGYCYSERWNNRYRYNEHWNNGYRYNQHNIHCYIQYRDNDHLNSDML